MTKTPALGRVRQEGYLKFKASLGYMINSRSAWATCLKNKGLVPT